MTYDEVLKRAKEVMMPKCRVCPDCNGLACRGEVPGLGGIGSGSSFTIARDYLKRVKLMMDVVYEQEEIDTSIELFGKKFDMPVFLAPIGGMGLNYTGYLKEDEYFKIITEELVREGSLAFMPDGPVDEFFDLAMDAVKKVDGLAVPTIKPWRKDILFKKIKEAEGAGAVAIACDIDSCGHVNLRKSPTPVETVSQEVIKKIADDLYVPFIIKGIMTVDAALKCADAGAYGIVVSTHGGRVIDEAPAPCSLLPEIKAAVGDRLKIFVDGGIRSGTDVFKCLALGADAVLIGRPYVQAAHGGKEEGVKLYTEKILGELKGAMLMTGCKKLEDINSDKIRIL